jgi:hypothetical protein
MTWAVEFEDEFEAEFDEWSDPVKVELLARAKCSHSSAQGWEDRMSIR